MNEPVKADEWSPDKWTHDAVMTMQARLAPGEIIRLAHEWNDIVEELNSMFATFLHDVRSIMRGGWRGEGARSARRGIEGYVANSRTTFAAARDLSSGLMTLAAAADDLQHNITPPPVEAHRYGFTDEVAAGQSLGLQTASLETALEQVRTRYSTPAVRAGNSLSELVDPYERITVADGTSDVRRAADEQSARAEEILARLGLAEPGQPTQTTTAASPPPSNLPTVRQPVVIPGIGQVEPAAPLAPDGKVHSGDPRNEEFIEDDIYANQDWSRDPWNQGNQTRSAAAEVPPDGAPKLTSDRLAVPGQAVPKFTQAIVTTGVTGRGTPGAVAPMMGICPPTQGRGHRSENEHRTPHYLVNRDNTEALLGRLPKASAPVIGAWPRDDRQ